MFLLLYSNNSPKSDRFHFLTSRCPGKSHSGQEKRYPIMRVHHAILFSVETCLATGNLVNGPSGAINESTPTAPEGEITVHSIDVSRQDHYFTPNSINALPGDIVNFKFWPGNHSIIRATYGHPCVPYEDIRGNDGQGFYSGVMSPDNTDVTHGNVRQAIQMLGDVEN